ncbi:MAG: hypothetical protein ACYTEL_17685 [Planctomycetota bacterium]|jgi:hypothetical protein
MIILFVVGSCLTAKGQCPQFEPGLQVGAVAHSSLGEISGIAASRGNTDVLWVHNDSGGSPRLFAMNRQGTHLGIYNLSGATNYDWEDIAIAPGPVGGVDYLYVGDIGDNIGSRVYVRVYRVAEPVVDSQQSPVETTLTSVDTIKLEYPDGPRNAEALMVDPVTKDIFIVSKTDSFSRVYRAPYPQSTTTTTTMEYKCELPWNYVSGGDISLDGDMIIVKTGEPSNNRASIWLRPAGTNLWDAFSGTECVVQLLSELNGEAICFDGDGLGYYTTSEGAHQPIHYFASVNAALAVTEIMSSSSHVGTNSDWWELTCAGTSTVDLAGYSWDDDHQRVGENVFGNVTIGPGESIIVIDADPAGVSAWKNDWDLGAEVGVYGVDYFSGSFSGLGSADGVFLYDPGGDQVTSVTYPSRTTGFSNEWDTDGTFLGLSAVGENGAYQSLNSSPDVASPGYAVIIIGPTPRTIYVDADASPGGNGTCWADAYKYLQDALNDATSGDEIRVAQGVYKPDQDEGGNVTPSDREATFGLINGLTIKGGYAGYGETDPNERNADVYETILSGDLNGNDVEVADACDLLDEPTRGENSYHVVVSSNTNETGVLDGFTITGGNADGSFDDEADRGGGMFNNGHNNPCNPTVTKCTFIGNSASQWGGGMSNFGHGDGECNPILTNCTFIGNAASGEGGGMHNWEAHVTVTNCTLTGNFTGQCGGGMANAGSNPTVSNCTFSGNSALEGGAMWNWEFSSPIVVNCMFRGNCANFGGGMTNQGAFCSPMLTNCTFSGNRADNDGGGMHNTYSNVPILTNCSFSANSAYDEGGGICNDRDSSPILINCILWGNEDAGGIDESAQIHTNGGTPVTNYSCVQGWTGGLGGDGNHGDNPLFVDADGADDIVGTQDDNLRVWGGSPCIDAGDNTAVPADIADLDNDGNTAERMPLDLDYGERFWDDPCTPDINGVPDPPAYPNVVDMGAYEYRYGTGTCWDAAECAGQASGDATCDGSVNLADLFALKFAFGNNAPWTAGDCCADFNHDDSVNLGDLFILKAGFGSSAYSPSRGKQNCPP